MYRDRSRYVGYQSLQSLVFQLVSWIGAGVLIGAIWLVTAVLSLVLIGLLLIPFAILETVLLGMVPLASLVYGVVAAIECKQGADSDTGWSAIGSAAPWKDRTDKPFSGKMRINAPD